MRKTALLLTLAILVTSVGGIGLADNADKPFAGTSLRIVLGNHAWTTSLKPYIPEFEEKTGIKVILEEYEINQVTEKTAIELSAKSNTLDVMFVRPQSELLLNVKNGWLAPVTEYAKADEAFDLDDFMSAALDSFTKNEQLWGIPICTERQLLFYRKDLFEAAGVEVPTTMEEMLAAAEKLHDPENGIYGFLHRSLVGMCQVASFLYSFGGGYQDAEGNSILGDPGTVAGFEYYGNILSKYSAPSPESLNYLEVFALFAQGKAAMISDVDANYLLLADPSATEYSDVIGFAEFPAGPAGSRPINSCSFGLSIAAFSEHKDAAWEFIRWATGKDINGRIQANGAPTARKSAWNDTELNRGLPEGLVAVNQAILAMDGGVGIDRPITLSFNEAREYIYMAINEAIVSGGQNLGPYMAELDVYLNEIYEGDR